MKITDLQVPTKFKILESRQYLYEGLDRSTAHNMMLWEGVGNRLVEYALTPDQINKIFQDAEAGMSGQGANRTMLGKGVDVAKTGVEATKEVNAAWEDLKTKISNSGPIKGFDQKVSDVLSKIGVGSKDPQFQGLVSNWVQKYRDFATQHPIIQGAVYATLIAVAGLSGAGVAGAAGLGLLKMADKLLQGERFSSAAYSGAKTGALAYGVGQAKQAYQAHQAAANAANGQGLPAHPSAASDYNGTANGPDGSNVTPPVGPNNATAPVAPGNVPGADAVGTTGGNLGGGDYTVMKGDSLGSIAQAQGIPDADLQGLNPQINFAKPLQPGMTINLPPAGDNAGSVWQGYQGGNYGDAAGAAHKAAGQAAGAATQQTDTATQAAGKAAGAIRNQADLDNYVQKSIDAGTTPTTPITSGPDLSGFTEVTPQGGDVTTQLKNLVAKGYQVARSQVNPSEITITDASGNLVQQFNPGNPFLASRLAAAANGVNLRESFIDTRQTARAWLLRESLGRPRGGVALTEMAIANILYEAGEAVDAAAAGAAPAATEPKKPGALQRIGNWFKQKGSNLTNKVTADKLKQAWIKQKMPDDSEEIAKILTDAGVGKAIISNIFKGMGIPAAAQTGAGAAQPDSQMQSPQSSQQFAPQSQTRQSGGTGTQAPAASTAQAQQAAQSQTPVPADSTAQDSNAGTGIANAVSKAGGAIDSVTAAMKRGQGMGATGQSLAAPSTKQGTEMIDPNRHVMYDKSGRAYTYVKKNGKWVDAQGGEVPPAFAASIEAQIKQKQTDALNKQKAGPGVDADAMAARRAAGAKSAAGAMKASNGTAAKTQSTQAGADAAKRINNTTPGELTAHGAGTTGPQTYNKGIQAFPKNDPTKAAQPMATANNANATAEPKEPTLNPEPQAQAKPAATSQNAGYGKATYNVPTSTTVPTATAAVPPKAPSITPTQLTPAQQQQQAALKAKLSTNQGIAAQTGTGMKRMVNKAKKQGIATAESKDFGAMLWKQMRDGK